MRFFEIISEDFTSKLASWFSGSKVVDKHGKPKRMFHGTGVGDIHTFNIEKASPTALYGPGFYFTDSSDVAGTTGLSPDKQHDEDMIKWKAAFNQTGYAWQNGTFDAEPLTKKQMAYAWRLFATNQVHRDAYEDLTARQNYAIGTRAHQEGEDAFRKWIINDAPRWFRDKLKVAPERTNRPTVIPVYLRITNPFEIDHEHPAIMLDEAHEAAGPQNQTLERRIYDWGLDKSSTVQGSKLYEFISNLYGGSRSGRPHANKYLQSLGYDGIHHLGGQMIGTHGDHDVWVAFSPKQIKSVFAATFSPDSEHISEGQ